MSSSQVSSVSSLQSTTYRRRVPIPSIRCGKYTTNNSSVVSFPIQPSTLLSAPLTRLPKDPRKKRFAPNSQQFSHLSTRPVSAAHSRRPQNPSNQILTGYTSANHLKSHPYAKTPAGGLNPPQVIVTVGAQHAAPQLAPDLHLNLDSHFRRLPSTRPWSRNRMAAFAAPVPSGFLPHSHRVS